MLKIQHNCGTNNVSSSIHAFGNIYKMHKKLQKKVQNYLVKINYISVSTKKSSYSAQWIIGCTNISVYIHEWIINYQNWKKNSEEDRMFFLIV